MRRIAGLGCTLVMAVTLSHAEVSNSASQTKASASPTSHHSAKSKHKKSRKTARRRGQQKIDSQRARQIQEALIREHYLTGKPSGVWDTATQAAMQKYQADNGWQTKTTPDSRALIKLGLGPDQEHLLNPESAMTSQPHPHAAPASASSKTTDPPSSPQPQK